MTTIDRINQLSAERARLYARTSNGLRGDANVRMRLADLSRQLEELWQRRRQERAGRPEGIDRLVDHLYEHTYGVPTEEARLGSGEDASMSVAA